MTKNYTMDHMETLNLNPQRLRGLYNLVLLTWHAVSHLWASVHKVEGMFFGFLANFYSSFKNQFRCNLSQDTFPNNLPLPAGLMAVFTSPYTYTYTSLNVRMT